MAFEELDLSKYDNQREKGDDPLGDVFEDHIDPSDEEEDDFVLNQLKEAEEVDLDDPTDNEEDDEDFDDEEDEEDLDDEDEEEEDLEDEDDEDEEEEEEDAPQDDDARKSRANQRIRQLAAKTKELESSLSTKDDEIYNLKARMVEIQKETVETNKSMLSRHKVAVQDQLKRAIEESDTTKMLELQEELRVVGNHLDAYTSWEAPKVEKQKPKQTNNGVTEPFQNWLNENPWFQNPKGDSDIEKIALADTHTKFLMQNKGYTLEDPELFEELSEKISGKKVAKSEKDMVQSKKSSKKKGRKTSTTKKKNRKVSQTVQGTSRTPANSGKSKRRKIQLTQAEKNVADTMGISYRDYANEKLRLESSESLGNMRPLKLR